MAHKLNFKIIVEGIESIKQKQIIKKIDPNIEYQGFIESPPIAPDEFKRRYLN
jgi:sensor c-di-GMP phosphodiesterase-like protein